METFRQILDLDEPGDHEFSLSMVEAYFEQAEETFRDLDKNLSVFIHQLFLAEFDALFLAKTRICQSYLH